MYSLGIHIRVFVYKSKKGIKLLIQHEERNLTVCYILAQQAFKDVNVR